jgi:1,2-phenylacetyl-CoA epoxidase catalytic subunit
MDIVERSQKAQEAINRIIGENSILKVINENQSKEIDRLREIINLQAKRNARLKKLFVKSVIKSTNKVLNNKSKEKSCYVLQEICE